ncbi:3-deoxy-7-phosphoheptulonate synthase, partial [bacterium]
MIVIMQHGATEAQIKNVIARVEQRGCRVHISEGEERMIIGVIGNGRPLDPIQFERISGVERVVPVLRPFKLASREFHPQDTVVKVNGVRIGGDEIVV